MVPIDSQEVVIGLLINSSIVIPLVMFSIPLLSIFPVTLVINSSISLNYRIIKVLVIPLVMFSIQLLIIFSVTLRCTTV